MGSSPSLYEGAFRLETTARPTDMFTSSLQATMMIGHIGAVKDDEDHSPMSSPVDDSSYKIRIGPRGSSSPNSQDDEDAIIGRAGGRGSGDGVGGGGGGSSSSAGGKSEAAGRSDEMDAEAQDLTVAGTSATHHDDGGDDDDAEEDYRSSGGVGGGGDRGIKSSYESRLNFDDENSMQ